MDLQTIVDCSHFAAPVSLSGHVLAVGRAIAPFPEVKVKTSREAWLVLSVFVALLAVAGMLSIAQTPAALGAPTTLYVAPNEDCGGASPCYASPQAAVDAATDGDSVKVAQGVYTSTAFQVLHIAKNVMVTGGFSVTDWENADPISRPTILDAENTPRRRGMVISALSSAQVVVEGLTIKRGYAQSDCGGGVYITSGIVTVRNSIIENNRQTGTITDNMAGGGVCIKGGVVILTRDIIQRNQSENIGAGIAALGGRVTLEHSAILTNTGAVEGGGLMAARTVLTATDNVFQGNSAGWGGGLILVPQGSFSMVRNRFENNIASRFGGGAMVRGPATFRDNIFCGNAASKPG